MNIVVCPNCGTQILPKVDGTCPSCLLPIAGKKKRPFTRPSAAEKKNKQDRAILIQLRNAWGLYCISFLLGFGIVMFDRIVWPWWPGILGIGLSILLTPIYLYYGLSQRRVYKVYLCLSILSSLGILPLLASGFQLMSYQVLQILAAICLCSLNLFVSYKTTRNNLLGKVGAQTGAFVNRDQWDFTKTIDPGGIQDRNQSIARILIPILAGSGALLSKVFPMTPTLGSVMAYTLACILAPIPGKHLAMMHYILDFEKISKKSVII